MIKTNAAPLSAAISDGAAAHSAYFADQEPIDGKITVVDLTDGACRWPTGNPRDLKTFRYCGEAAAADRIVSATLSSPTCRDCREPPDRRLPIPSRFAAARRDRGAPAGADERAPPDTTS